MNDDRHLMTEHLAAYLDGSLPRDRVDALEAHLAQCDACRADLVAAQRVLVWRSNPRRAFLLGGALVAAALLIGMPALLSKAGQRGLPDEERATPVPFPVVVTLPADDAIVPAGAVRFVWRSAGAAVQYRITVTDSAGGRIWSAEQSDTAATLDATRLAKAALYFWFVDALLADGRTRTSGTHRFSTPP